MKGRRREKRDQNFNTNECHGRYHFAHKAIELGQYTDAVTAAAELGLASIDAGRMQVLGGEWEIELAQQFSKA